MSIRSAHLPAFFAAAILTLVGTTATGQGKGDSPVFADAKTGTVPASAPAGEPAAKDTPEKLKPEERIRRALQQPTELHASETSLEDVVDLLKEKHKIEIQLDKKALDDVGIAADTQVTKSLKGISLRSALRLILHELDLTYMIKDEMLLITTPEVADQCLELKVYDVADLALGEADASSCFEQLIDAVTGCIRPATYDCAGGPGAIRRFDVGGIRALVVSQTQEVHEEIADLLARLREVRRTPRGESKPDKQPGDVAPAVAATGPKLSAAAQVIRRALAKPIAVEFKEKPLKDVVAVLQEKAGVPMLLDKRALDDVGTAEDTPVTAKTDGLKLRSTLDLILKPVELTWTVRNDAVQITTPEVAEQTFHMRTYDVSDFHSFRNAQGQPVPDYHGLIRAITGTAQPRTWERNGGPGSIKPFEGQGVQSLVVTHTWQVHEEIEALLSDLRKTRTRSLTKEEISKLPPAPPPGRKQE